jgi:hypothetical protein
VSGGNGNDGGGDMSHRLAEVSRAVDAVLISAHGLLHDLLAHHEKAGTAMPPFTVVSGDLGPEENRKTAMADALRAYGGMPGPLFNLWVHLAAFDVLRSAWLGRTP